MIGFATRRTLARRALETSMNHHPAIHPRLFVSNAKDNTNDSIPLWYPVVGGLVITMAGGIKWFHDHVGGTEGLVRSASFYSYAIPKYCQYRFHMYMQSPDEVWEELDRDTSQGALKKIQKLGGFYIKSGQLASNLSAL
jgi:hypothetical protein